MNQKYIFLQVAEYATYYLWSMFAMKSKQKAVITIDVFITSLIVFATASTNIILRHALLIL